MKLFISALLFVSLCYTSLSSGTKDRFVCQSVEDSDLFPKPPMAQGRPGKIGPKGLKGDLGDTGVKGDRGPEGVVNYERVNATIDTATNVLDAKISSLEDTVRKMKESISETAYKWCKYRYEGKCYRALVHAKFDVPYQTGLEFCKEWDMEPAEIVGSRMLEKLIRYVATEIPPGKNVADIVIGMSYNPANRRLKFNNGSRASFVRWYPGYPKSDSGRTGMGMVAHKSWNIDEGMYNLHRDNHQGILCQK